MKILILLSIFFNMSINAFMIKNKKAILEKLSDFSLCHQHRHNSSLCLEALKDWLETNPSDNWKAAKLVRLNYNSYVALNFFKRAEKSEDFKCSDRDLKLAVKSALELPLKLNKEIINNAKHLTFTKCKDVLPTYLADKFSLTSSAFKIICKELKKMNLLKGLKKKKCK